MNVEFLQNIVVKSINCHQISMIGCELLCDNKVVAIFDRDSGGGWMILDDDGDPINDELYSLKVT